MSKSEENVVYVNSDGTGDKFIETETETKKQTDSTQQIGNTSMLFLQKQTMDK